ncbi:hypothetical protein [Paenibacillus alginolyticus]|uniref:Uncharacterized protein n=1 Tax=Paenibacillus alginolyticus TaxID=59839 RepID=A0ABT4GHM1_9BACL|nr:hypothetical protein [Paenibacillus alginolyticus]MCY9695616.1 hypothetical protein [Paenibacillus alginolyticus]
MQIVSAENALILERTSNKVQIHWIIGRLESETLWSNFEHLGCNSEDRRERGAVISVIKSMRNMHAERRALFCRFTGFSTSKAGNRGSSFRENVNYAVLSKNKASTFR